MLGGGRDGDCVIQESGSLGQANVCYCTDNACNAGHGRFDNFSSSVNLLIALFLYHFIIWEKNYYLFNDPFVLFFEKIYHPINQIILCYSMMSIIAPSIIFRKRRPSLYIEGSLLQLNALLFVRC